MKNFRRIVALLMVLLVCSQSFAAVVSDNDGSAFITKAEFDSLKNSFQAQIDNYNASIDSKIDGAIAAYLAGIRIEQGEQFNFEWVDDFPTDSVGVLPAYRVDVISVKIVGNWGGINAIKGVGGLSCAENSWDTNSLDLRAAWFTVSSFGTINSTTKISDGGYDDSRLKFLTCAPGMGTFIVPCFCTIGSGSTIGLVQNNYYPGNNYVAQIGCAGSYFTRKDNDVLIPTLMLACDRMDRDVLNTKKIVSGHWSDKVGYEVVVHNENDSQFSNSIFMPLLKCTEGSGNIRFSYYSGSDYAPDTGSNMFVVRSSTSGKDILLSGSGSVGFAKLNILTGVETRIPLAFSQLFVTNMYTANQWNTFEIDLGPGDFLGVYMEPNYSSDRSLYNGANEAARLKFNAIKL